MIKKLLLKLLKKEIDSIEYNCYQIHRENDYKRRQDTDIFSVREDLGKKIVYCSNEWEDPLFGMILGVTYVTAGNTPMALVECAFTKEHLIVHPGSYYVADRQMVECILKLNPFERWNMSCKNRSQNMWTKSYPLGEITPPEVLLEKLISVGFIS